ncbi:hypothetical protein CLV62_12936 [Dysgonomonas alginatilytica]|uniref:Uncharacterized protein n=1 Tax=Dysgonomonas alginatilytica TaxID=1605892 RepID=A0A2V3PJA3_9BACT|nr:hypothetical protein [Dysgonomonas alginatilytica]PXV60260.1 hypothetical protein CLV62_12936 [Dysgonomonas alginatilytica]
MKTKLTPLQELRLERSRLKNECAEYEEKLHGNWHYAKGHFGRLALGSVFSSAKSGIADLFSLGKNHESDEDSEENTSSPSLVTQMFLGAAPFVWEMVQPMIMNMIMKKIKSIFGGGENKTKKKLKKKNKASDLD